MTLTAEDRDRRELMTSFVHRTAYSFVLKETATTRWGDEVTVRIAERGTFKGIPVKGWTHTDTGTIFMREEIFDGIDLTSGINRQTINVVTRRLILGRPVNKAALFEELRRQGYWSVGDSEREICWRIAQTIVANYGVFGHEYGHAAYSEHARRGSWQMALEDLRTENLWMTRDPIRARQGLRACAQFWVTHDASPMTGERAFDFTAITTQADLLHLYLLVVGRGRIDVLDNQSVLVNGVRDLARQVLGWETTSEADDIIDRFLETSESLDDPEGAAERAALAEEFSRLLPEQQPHGDLGCSCDPQGQSGESDGQDAGGAEGEGEDDGQGRGSGQAGTDQDATPGERGGQGGGDSAPGDGTESGDGDVEGGSEGDGEGEGLTVGSDVHDGDTDGGTTTSDDSHTDFITGTFGEEIRIGVEEVTDALDDSDAFRLTQEQVEALAEVLTEGLEEVSSTEDGAGWEISDDAGAIILSRSVDPAKVAAEVFSRKALTTRNRRVKI